MTTRSKMPAWFAPALALSGLAVVLSALVLLKSPTSSPLNPEK
jgi:hypothetical protein